MANYPAPSELLPLFTPSVFDVNDIPLTIAEGEKYFITYPVAQGAVTIPTLSTGTLGVSGTATIGTMNATTAGVSGTATIGTMNATTAGVSGTATIGTMNATTAGVSGTATIGTADITGNINTTNSSDFATIYGFETTKPTSGTSIHNTAYGYQAAKTLVNTTGTGGNTAFGAIAMTAITGTSNNNTAIGHNALRALTTGDNNTQVGMTTSALANNLTTGNNNTLIGHSASVSGTSISNSTAIGYNAQATASNQIVLGTTAETIRYNKMSPLYTSLTTNPYSSTDIGYVYQLDNNDPVSLTGYGVVGALQTNYDVEDVVSTTNNLPIGIYLVIVNIFFGSTSNTPTRIDFRIGTNPTTPAPSTLMTIVGDIVGSTYFRGSCIVINTNATNDFFLFVKSVTGTPVAGWSSASQIQYIRIA